MTYQQAVHIQRFPALYPAATVSRANRLVESGRPDDEPQRPSLLSRLAALLRIHADASH